MRVAGCSENDAGVVDAEVGGGCVGEAPTAGDGSVSGDGGGNGDGGGGGGSNSIRGGGGGGDSEGGSTKQQQGSERCPQCGILCRDVHVLQLHLEDTHKTSYPIDKHDLNAQFSQVVSDREQPSRTSKARARLSIIQQEKRVFDEEVSLVSLFIHAI